MGIIDNMIIVTLHVLCFIAGLKLANWYHANAERDRKDALERQFVRLQTRSDADDPCKPYVFPAPIVAPSNNGFDDVKEQFADRLKKNGQATAMLKNRK